MRCDVLLWKQFAVVCEFPMYKFVCAGEANVNNATEDKHEIEIVEMCCIRTVSLDLHFGRTSSDDLCLEK